MGLDEGPGPGPRSLPFSNRLPFSNPPSPSSSNLSTPLPVASFSLQIYLISLSRISAGTTLLNCQSQPKRLVSKSTIIENQDNKNPAKSRKSNQEPIKIFTKLKATDRYFLGINAKKCNNKHKKVQDLIEGERELGYLKIYTGRWKAKGDQRQGSTFFFFSFFTSSAREREFEWWCISRWNSEKK